jgi:hypothetical protein
MANATFSEAVPAGTPVHGYSALFCRLPVGHSVLLPLQDRYTISQAMRQEHQCSQRRFNARSDLKTNTLRLRRVA